MKNKTMKTSLTIADTVLSGTATALLALSVSVALEKVSGVLGETSAPSPKTVPVTRGKVGKIRLS